MDPMTIMALMSGAQGLLGMGQTIGAASRRSRAERNFDEFEVPQGVMSMLDIAHGMSSQTQVPGADIFRDKAMGGLSAGVEEATRSAESGADVLGGLQEMFGSYMGFEKDLLVKGAEMQKEAKGREIQVLGQIGEHQTQKWMYNELYPYMQQMTAAGQGAQAGMGNIQSALSTGVGMAGTKYSMGELDRILEEYGQSKSS